jgi:hypothetical protein
MLQSAGRRTICTYSLDPALGRNTYHYTSKQPDIKTLQIQLTGFLEKDTPAFCKELWTLCLSAQSNPQGVPKELLEAKKLELIQEKASALLQTCAFNCLIRGHRLKRKGLPSKLVANVNTIAKQSET